MAHHSPEQRTVLVDMDGVLANFDQNVLRIMQRDFPEITPPEVRNNFYLDDDMPEHRHVVTDIISRPGFFLELERIEGALEGWALLIEHGYLPRICSAPLRKNPTSIEDKISWLEEHFVPSFGSAVVDLAIFDKQKWLHSGLALIDDRPNPNEKNIERIKPSWEHVVFDQPYNQVSDARYRMLSWDDSILIEILRELSAF